MIFNRRKGRTAKPKVLHLLESGTDKSLREAKRTTQKLLSFHWNYYSELARQRNLIKDDIIEALTQPCTSFEINNWQRGVKYKYGLHPLSIVGSLTNIGGRFNTGVNVNTELPSFPALYIAINKDTALQEHLGQTPNELLSPREMALTNPASETIVSISGKFDKVFDLTNEASLEPFIKLIKQFELSKELKVRAHELGEPNPETIKTTRKLLESLLMTTWRDYPSRYDIPANSQIFGHLIYTSGVEGILYPSKLTNEPCLALFPRNFQGTDSYIELDDETPHHKVPIKIDGTNWRLSELSSQEIFGFEE